jgi:hypothetical protein
MRLIGTGYLKEGMAWSFRLRSWLLRLLLPLLLPWLLPWLLLLLLLLLA